MNLQSNISLYSISDIVHVLLQKTSYLSIDEELSTIEETAKNKFLRTHLLQADPDQPDIVLAQLRQEVVNDLIKE